MITKNYKYSIPAVIFFMIAGFSFLNNFGWDLLQSDNVTYVSSGFGLLVAYLSHKRIKDPLSLVLVVIRGVLPIIEEQYEDNKNVLKLLRGFDTSIQEYEASEEDDNDEVCESEKDNDNVESTNNSNGGCSCSDDDGC